MWFTGFSQQVRSVLMWTFTLGLNPKLLQITWAIVLRLYSDLKKKPEPKEKPPTLSAIFSCSWPIMVTLLSVSKPNGTQKSFPFFPLHLLFNFQRIMECRRVISIRLTSCELINWCFGLMTTAADFRIICAAQVHGWQRLKQLVSIWLSLKCEWIHQQPKKIKRNKNKNKG